MNENGNNVVLKVNDSPNFLGEFLPKTANLLGLEAHLDNRREMKEESPLMGSSRWNPTAEQLLALEEMYRRGTRTPTADQIQQIATQLRRFGKIEGKNVFYWFQNHKARERQKRRREAESCFKFPKHDRPQTLDNKHSGLKAVLEEVEQKNSLLVSSSNCSDNLEGQFSMQREEENMLHQYKSGSTEKNCTWHAMDVYPNSPRKFLNKKNTSRSSRMLNTENEINGIKGRWINKNEEAEVVETLELFPLCSSEDNIDVNVSRNKINIKDTKVGIRAINTKQYFEFLPVKK